MAYWNVIWLSRRDSEIFLVRTGVHDQRAEQSTHDTLILIENTTSYLSVTIKTNLLARQKPWLSFIYFPELFSMTFRRNMFGWAGICGIRFIYLFCFLFCFRERNMWSTQKCFRYQQFLILKYHRNGIDVLLDSWRYQAVSQWRSFQIVRNCFASNFVLITAAIVLFFLDLLSSWWLRRKDEEHWLKRSSRSTRKLNQLSFSLSCRQS